MSETAKPPRGYSVHRVSVQAYYEDWKAECSCGWVGPPRALSITADGDARKHKISVSKFRLVRGMHTASDRSEVQP